MSNNALFELAEAAKTLMNPCRLCPRNCRVDRSAGQIGFCGVGKTARICKELVHYAEEPDLAPTYSVYFAGCNMRCEYCSNHIMLNPDCPGKSPDHIALAKRIDLAMAGGAKTIFFLGGEPACSLYDVLLILANVKSGAPVVWNSNMYISPEAFELLMQISDVFLADMKFGNDQCAVSLAKTPDYLENVRRNILYADKSGKKQVIRHLPLSGHLECCTIPVLRWLAENCPEIPLGILPLIPTEKTCLKPPSKKENTRIQEEIEKLGLRQVNYAVKDGLPRVEAKTRTVESVLHIRRNGSIAVQDITGEIVSILSKVGGDKIEL